MRHTQAEGQKVARLKGDTEHERNRQPEMASTVSPVLCQVFVELFDTKLRHFVAMSTVPVKQQNKAITINWNAAAFALTNSATTAQPSRSINND